MSIMKKVSIISQGLRYKLSIAFSLMTIIPLLICLYIIAPYLFSESQKALDHNMMFLFALIIAMLGLVIAKGIIDAVINLASEARRIAIGEYERKVAVSTEDEIGNLGHAINLMTQKIRTNLEELRGYGQSMKELDLEIHKKVLALSSLLQIGDIVSAGALQIDALLNLVVEKVSRLFDNVYAILYLPREEGGDFVAKTSFNIDNEKLEGLIIRRDGGGVLERILRARTALQIDKGTRMTRDLDDFRQKNGVRNMLAVPLYSDRSLLGLLVVGTRLNDFKFSADDVDLVSVFAKHIIIAIENDTLSRKNEELVTRDELTGMFNKRFILARLEEEIRRAIFYQRPCAFVAFNIDNFKKFQEAHGELAAEDALKHIAKAIKDNMTPVGRAARTGWDEFAMLLPEKNKREATFIAEEIRKKIETVNVLNTGQATLTVCGGVSENPIDGATCEELYKKAMEAVDKAKAAGKNRIVA